MRIHINNAGEKNEIYMRFEYTRKLYIRVSKVEAESRRITHYIGRIESYD